MKRNLASAGRVIVYGDAQKWQGAIWWMGAVAANLCVGSAILIRNAHDLGGVCDHIAHQCGLRSAAIPPPDRLYFASEAVERLRALTREIMIGRRSNGEAPWPEYDYSLRFRAVTTDKINYQHAEHVIDWQRSKWRRDEFHEAWAKALAQ